jgi:transcriptional regulator with XRE-family HTH domain
VTPEEIAQLRKDLGCTVAELAETIGLLPNQVRAWEAGDAFPTKRHTERLQRLREQGVGGSDRPGQPAAPPTAVLDDARLWQIVRRLVENPSLIDKVQSLLDRHERRSKQ